MAAMTHHKGTRQVIDVLTRLAVHEGWMSVAELATALDLHRDTTRAVLAELAAAGWVQHRPADDLYTLGVELVRVALARHNRLAAQTAQLRSELDRMSAPLTVKES